MHEEPIFSAFVHKENGIEYPSVSCIMYDILKKEGNPMSCVYHFRTDDFVYFASDSLNLRFNDKGEIIGKQYVPKIIKRDDNVLFAYWGRSTFTYNGKVMEMDEIIKNMTKGVSVLAGIKALKENIKEQLKIKERWGMIFSFIEDGKILSYILELYPQLNTRQIGELFFEFKDFGGIFCGINYKRARYTNYDSRIITGDLDALRELIKMNEEDDRNIRGDDAFIGGEVQIYKLSISGEIKDLTNEKRG